MDPNSGSIGAVGDRANFVTLEKSLKRGEQGETWLAHSSDQALLHYVVKICRTKNDTPSTSFDDFKRECDALVAMDHPNIVRIVDSGKELSRGNASVPYPFYTMEYLGSDVKTLKEALADPEILGHRKILLCLCALKDATSALAHVHEKGYYHGDIKESNILIQRPKGPGTQIKLIDFGFSDHLVPEVQREASPPGPQQGSSIRRRGAKCSKEQSDVFQLCYMVRRSLRDSCPRPEGLSEDQLEGWPIDYAVLPHLRTVLDEWASEDLNSKPETHEPGEFVDALATLTKTYDLSPAVTAAVRYLSVQEIATAAQIREAFEAIRIPPRQLVLYTDRIKELITTRQFGSLRYIRQLGFTHLVYPGAQGTRFEHSLGMYDLACQVVLRMSGHEEFRKACGVDYILKFILAALLHDVGHFPLAHQLEEFRRDSTVEDIPCVRNLVMGHEHRGRQVIGELANKIEKLFGFSSSDIDDLTWLAFGADGGHDSKPAALQFLRLLLDGPIDLDKLDYIERDAHHCGVPYGSYLDMARIKETMRVFEEQGTPKLAFDSRVVGSLEQFATARHELYANVYWHRAVRSATVMFKHAFYLFQQLINDQARLEDLFYRTTSDDCLLYRMMGTTEQVRSQREHDASAVLLANAVLALLQVVSGRERVLYKMVWEKTRDQESVDTPYGGQFYAMQRSRARSVFETLQSKGFLSDNARDLGEHNVLLDCHTDDFPHFGDIPILKGSEKTLLRDHSPAIDELKNNFVRQACKIRIFVNPTALKPEYQSKAGRRRVTEALAAQFTPPLS